MSAPHKIMIAAVLAGTVFLAGCASQGEVGSMTSRMSELEQKVTDLGNRVDALAASDRAAAERAAKAAEDAKRAAEAAAASSAKVEEAFRKSLRK